MPSMKRGKPRIKTNIGKGSTSEMLPSRHALATLTKGDPAQRSMQNYAKLTPGADSTSPSIEELGSKLSV